MGNLAQSAWADEPCEGRRGHRPCGQRNWDCECPVEATAEYRKRKIERDIRALQDELDRLNGKPPEYIDPERDDAPKEDYAAFFRDDA